MSHATFIEDYQQAVATGVLRADASQLKAAQAFQTLYARLTGAESAPRKRWLFFSAPALPSGGLYIWAMSAAANPC